MNPEQRLSQRALRTREQPISYLMHQALANPELISLAAGFVDQETLPAAEMARAVAELSADPVAARRALQYGTTQGDPRLRELLAAHLEELEGRPANELHLTPERIVVTTGSQQLLGLVGDVLLDPGDIVLVEAPGYFVYMGTLAALGAEAIGVPMDDGGMRLDLLEERLSQLEAAGRLDRVKLIYVVSYYQNPTGLSLARERRSALVEIARRWSSQRQMFILEDAAYRELRYESAAEPSIWSFDPDGQTVILAQTFSKPLAPGVKTGYGVLPDALREPVLLQKSIRDFGSANWTQHLLAQLLESRQYHAHLEDVVARYRVKLQVMLDALAESFAALPETVRWTRPAGGLYVWAKLPEGVDTGREGTLFHRCLEKGVLYVPGAYCYPAGMADIPCNTLRLSFGVQSEAGIRAGVQFLAEAVSEEVEGLRKEAAVAGENRDAGRRRGRARVPREHEG